MQWLANDVLSTEAMISLKGDYVTVQASVSTIEQLLDAKYTVFGRMSPATYLDSYLCLQPKLEQRRRP
jgi:hypothetical protein